MLYKLRHLKRIHGQTVILDIPHLDIEAGKIHALTGANGAGKTTLLNILAFLDRQEEGDVYFHSKVVRKSDKDLLQARKQVVLVEQYPLLFTAPVWKSVEFGLAVRRVPKKERKERVERVLELVGMQDFYHADGATLSGGETKRVALARALVVEPAVLLCDEPTANVDAENQEIILNILKHCNRRQNISILFATHYLSQAQRLSHETIVLQHGKLSSVGGVNVFRGVVEKNGNSGLVCHLPANVTIKLPGTMTPPVDAPVRVFLNPDEISLVASRNAGSSHTYLQATIQQIRRDSDRVELTLDAGIRLVVNTTRDAYQQQPLFVEQQVLCAIPLEALVIS